MNTPTSPQNKEKETPETQETTQSEIAFTLVFTIASHEITEEIEMPDLKKVLGCGG